MRIKVILPVVSDLFDETIRQELKEFVSNSKAEIEFNIEHLTYGPASIESAYDEALAVPDILFKVKQAADEGYDGVFIDCFGDPGVQAAREIVDIPVMGGFEPSVLLAAGLGQALGIVTVLPNVLPICRSNLAAMGLKHSRQTYMSPPEKERHWWSQGMGD